MKDVSIFNKLCSYMKISGSLVCDMELEKAVILQIDKLDDFFFNISNPYKKEYGFWITDSSLFYILGQKSFKSRMFIIK